MTALVLAALLSQELPDGFEKAKVADRIDGAVALAVAPDGRVFICEQTGALRVWKDGALLDEPFVALKVDSFWERGLIGVALDPGFPGRPYVYVNYVSPDPYPHHVVSRFTARGDRAEPGSEKILLEGDDQTKMGGSVPAGHQGGAVHFGPDGKLYVGIGEQTAGKPSQNLDTFLGKILRINPDGTIPEDNPFVATARGKYRAIWAIGLRNPFAFAFQAGTGRMFINDVGGSLWEEVNEGVAGGNYGWPHSEGPTTDPRFRGPVHAYPRGLGKSITGGVFYDPPARQFPAEYHGKYFFMDYDANWIHVMDPARPKSVRPFAKNLVRPVDLALAPDGSLYVLNRNAWVKDKKYQPHTGSLWRIRYTGAAPAARSPSAGPRAAALGLPLNVDRWPARLSKNPLFAAASPPAPVGGLVPYDVIVPQWMDGASKRRWIALPEGTKLGYAPRGDWSFPPGTVLVEQIEYDRPVETRILAVDAYGGAVGAAYRWNAEGADADLDDEGNTVEITAGGRKRPWTTAGPLECLSCHSPPAGLVLGVNARQLTAESLARLAERGLLEPRPAKGPVERLVPLSDASAPIEARVRSYLDANCGGCHRPNGPGRGLMDARFETPLAKQQLVGAALIAGDLGVKDARNVVPGDLGRSILYERMKRRGDPFKMPPIGSHEPDPEALRLLAEWIRSLPK